MMNSSTDVDVHLLHHEKFLPPKNFASFKLDLLATINGDRRCPSSCLKVSEVYCSLFTEKNPYPFCTISKMMARTGLSRNTIEKAKAILIELGYLKRRGQSNRVPRYALLNPHKSKIKENVKSCLHLLKEKKRCQQMDWKSRNEKLNTN